MGGWREGVWEMERLSGLGDVSLLKILKYRGIMS